MASPEYASQLVLVTKLMAVFSARGKNTFSSPEGSPGSDF